MSSNRKPADRKLAQHALDAVRNLPTSETLQVVFSESMNYLYIFTISEMDMKRLRECRISLHHSNEKFVNKVLDHLLHEVTRVWAKSLGFKQEQAEDLLALLDGIEVPEGIRPSYRTIKDDNGTSVLDITFYDSNNKRVAFLPYLRPKAFTQNYERHVIDINDQLKEHYS